MKYLQYIEEVEILKTFVRDELNLIGVKAPKSKKCKNKEEQQHAVSGDILGQIS